MQDDIKFKISWSQNWNKGMIMVRKKNKAKGKFVIQNACCEEDTV